MKASSVLDKVEAAIDEEYYKKSACGVEEGTDTFSTCGQASTDTKLSNGKWTLHLTNKRKSTNVDHSALSTEYFVIKVLTTSQLPDLAQPAAETECGKDALAAASRHS